MAGSKGINGRYCLGAGVQEEAQLGRRWHPCVGGRGGACSDSWGADLGGDWQVRMRQAELAGKGTVWAGGDHDSPSRPGSGAVGGTDGQSHQLVTERMKRARKGLVYQHPSLQRPVSVYPVRVQELAPV